MKKSVIILAISLLVTPMLVSCYKPYVCGTYAKEALNYLEDNYDIYVYSPSQGDMKFVVEVK